MSKWTNVPYGDSRNPGVWDTGNGAIRTVEENRDYPGIERVTVASYCGRTYDNRRYYRLADRLGESFDTVGQAEKARRDSRQSSLGPGFWNDGEEAW